MQSFKALHHLTCQGKEYEPGNIIPGATSFPNLKEMIEWRYIGYATDEEAAAYETKQAELAEIAEQAEKQQKADEQAKQDQLDALEKQAKQVAETSKQEKPSK